MNDLATLDTVNQKMLDQLESQGALHGGLGYAFMRLGGMERLIQWAGSDDKNLAKFYNLLFKAQPSLIPVHAQQGDIQVHVHTELQPTPLDGEFEDVSEE